MPRAEIGMEERSGGDGQAGRDDERGDTQGRGHASDCGRAACRPRNGAVYRP